jgi:hypothetical protein
MPFASRLGIVPADSLGREAGLGANKMPVENLVQAGMLKPSVVPGVAISSVRPLNRERGWPDVRIEGSSPDQAESSPGLVGTASREVMSAGNFPAAITVPS